MVLSLNDYQSKAHSTAVYPVEQGLEYTALGLCSEAGEYAGKVKKAIRGDIQGNVSQMIGELGDVLWYVSECATVLGIQLDDVAERNLEKLSSRAERGVIKGSGDSR